MTICMRMLRVLAVSKLCLGLCLLWQADLLAGQLAGTIVDRQTGQPIPVRVYLRPADAPGDWMHVEPAEGGEAIPYRVVRGGSVEVHTTISAEGFVVDLVPGAYELTIEAGKEYLPLVERVEIGEPDQEVRWELSRWIDMAELGWYSGETHVHRPTAELPLLQQAENLNVAFPLTYWVTDSRQRPTLGPGEEGLQDGVLTTIDDTHVYWPTNTEYEIFTIDGQGHTLGAIFLLNHRERLELTAPPIRPIVQAAREQAGDQGPVLTDLDKHNWPWSMMLIPIAEVDLYELTNNHVWRTDFLFNTWYPNYVPSHLEIEKDANGLYTEQGWIDYGLETYYLLLNCGYRLRPTAGTASGVHPVPLGFGRVYVHMESEFSYPSWVEGLSAGRSFATTGPLLDLRFNQALPGTTFDGTETETIQVTGRISSPDRLTRVEVVVNGRIMPLSLEMGRTDAGVWEVELDETFEIADSAWLAVRCFAETNSGRPRFAHTGPVYRHDPDHPLRPSPEEVEFLVRRMHEEIERHEGVLSDDAIEEYREAARQFRRLRHEE